jgi:hypothetical protein
MASGEYFDLTTDGVAVAIVLTHDGPIAIGDVQEALRAFGPRHQISLGSIKTIMHRARRVGWIKRTDYGNIASDDATYERAETEGRLEVEQALLGLFYSIFAGVNQG